MHLTVPKGHAPRARARRSDPATSHLAASEVNVTGHARHQRTQAYAIVREHEGLTSRELAARMASDPLIVFHKYDLLHRRLPELRESGWLKNGKIRECRVSTRKAQTWWLVIPRPDRQLDFFDDEVRL
jgi:hypothetical protein